MTTACLSPGYTESNLMLTSHFTIDLLKIGVLATVHLITFYPSNSLLIGLYWGGGGSETAAQVIYRSIRFPKYCFLRLYELGKHL